MQVQVKPSGRAVSGEVAFSAGHVHENEPGSVLELDVEAIPLLDARGDFNLQTGSHTGNAGAIHTGNRRRGHRTPVRICHGRRRIGAFAAWLRDLLDELGDVDAGRRSSVVRVA
jgi:hypothetical protein